MDAGLWFLATVVGSVLVGVLAPVRFRERAPRFRVRPFADLADGKPGAVEGVVVAGERLLRAPISGASCVYWQLVFHEVGAKDYVERGRAHQPNEFFLETPDGRARVAVDRARLGARPHRVEYRDRYVSAPPAVRDLAIAQARAIGIVFARPESRLRVLEYVIAPKQRIRVKGDCVLEPDPTAVADVSGYRNALPTRPVISGTRRAPLLIATTP